MFKQEEIEYRRLRVREWMLSFIMRNKLILSLFFVCFLMNAGELFLPNELMKKIFDNVFSSNNEDKLKMLCSIGQLSNEWYQQYNNNFHDFAKETFLPFLHNFQFDDYSVTVDLNSKKNNNLRFLIPFCIKFMSQLKKITIKGIYTFRMKLHKV
jgi:hypothetical protein